MTGQSSRCPDPETLAAFVAGSLSGAELKMTADHLLNCEDCRLIVADIAAIDRTFDIPVRKAAKPGATTWPWWLAAAAAALACVAFVAYWRGSTRHTEAIAILIAAAPRDHRVLEPRLTGDFPWAPLRSALRTDAPLDAAQMKLIGAAGVVLDRTAGDTSPDAQHAAAVAHLLAGRPREAADLLEKVASSTKNERIWSDLAAMRYTAAMGGDDPGQFAQALAAADAALRLNPRAPEALFNRALIIERLGLRDEARLAWERYLTVDSVSAWAREARTHLGALTPAAEFRDELERNYDRLAASAEAASAFSSRFPQQSRVWGETEILARWAEAWKRGDIASADRHLRLARHLGDALVRANGDRMVAGVVAAVDRADDSRRLILADAHLVFRDAQRTYSANRAADAERMFAAAIPGFEQAKSPIAIVARYFEANTMFVQGHVAEAQARLEQLRGTASEDYPAHRAQVEWQLGLAYAAHGRWGDAMRTLADSVSRFERLHEMHYATSVREILAEVYDRIGDRRVAWEHRMAALRELGRSESPRLQVAVDSAARSAAIGGDWPVSLSFLSVVIDMAHRAGGEVPYIESLLLRARIHGRLQQPDAAASDLRSATVAIARLHDRGLREHAEAELLAVEGFLAPAPRESVTRLTRAIEFHRAKGRRMSLPDMLLHRGRAYVALGEHDRAAADFEAGIREVETQRQSIERHDDRWGMFATADELFDAALAHALQRGDERTAFAYAERARGREVLDAMVPVSPTATPVVPRDAIVVEYAVLPEQLVIFVLDRGIVRSTTQPVRRADLELEIERLTSSAVRRNEAQFRQGASVLFELLIAPIRSRLAVRRPLVFVPDAPLDAVPFAALMAPNGRFLLEDNAIVVSPSAAVYMQLAKRPDCSPGDVRLLLVAGPASTDVDSFNQLSAVQREVDAVTAIYGRRADVATAENGVAAFRTRAASADVIHFVGHAVIPDSSGAGALVTSRGDPGSILGVREIASLGLTRTRTVILAACGTARGPSRDAPGNISVARAFVAAGVPSVVATLWPIEDAAAADFFPLVHKRLVQGLSPAEALRGAQIEWIHHRDGPAAMWAAVQLIGS